MGECLAPNACLPSPRSCACIGGHDLEISGLLIGPDGGASRSTNGSDEAEESSSVGDAVIATIRLAIRRERKLHIEYRDASDRVTRRTIWPFALGYFRQARVVAAWCELRVALRHFRTDQIQSLSLGYERYPQRRAVLLAQWRREQGIAADGF